MSVSGDKVLDKKGGTALFVLSIALVLAGPLWVRIPGWILLGYMVMRSGIAGVCALAVLSFFFDDALGTFKLFFTLKPFHIVTVLLLLKMIFRNGRKTFADIRRGWRSIIIPEEISLCMVFLTASFLSSFFGTDVAASLLQTANIVPGMIAMVLIREYANGDDDIAVVIDFFIAGAMAKIAVFIIDLYYCGGDGLFILHSVMASPLSLAIFLQLARLHLSKKDWQVVMWSVACAISLFFIYCSGTRVFILASVIGIAVFLSGAIFIWRRPQVTVLCVLLLMLVTVLTFGENPNFRNSARGMLVNIAPSKFKGVMAVILHPERYQVRFGNPLQYVSFKDMSKGGYTSLRDITGGPESHVRKLFERYKALGDDGGIYYEGGVPVNWVSDEAIAAIGGKTYFNGDWTTNQILYALGHRRYEDWTEAVRTINDGPVIGKGLRSEGIGSHNLYLELFAATGVFGFVAFFGLVITLFFRNAFRAFRGGNKAAWGIACGVSAWCISSMTSAYYVQHYIWVFFGIGYALTHSTASMPRPFRTGIKSAAQG